MNNIVKQLINTFNLIQDEDFSNCYLPNSLCYPHSGYMLNVDDINSTISLAEDISYSFDKDNNNPVIMFCGNTFHNLDDNSYNNIVNIINDLLDKHNNVIKQIKNHLINNQLNSIKTDF